MKRFFLIIYQVFIWLPIVFIITILTALITIIGCLVGSERIFSYYPGMLWSKLMCIITFCPVKVIGKEKLDKTQSYIFAANHQGAYDIFLLYGYLGQPIKWIMKKSLRKIPLVGKACESAGFIFVDNSSPQAAAKTVEKAETKLKNGASVVIFPEGSRSKTGKMNVFKKGAFQMALNLKLPIVPVTINGSFDVLPVYSYFINPRKMEVIIHDPIETADLHSENIRELSGNIRILSDQTGTAIQSSLWDKYQA